MRREESRVASIHKAVSKIGIMGWNGGMVKGARSYMVNHMVRILALVA